MAEVNDRLVVELSANVDKLLSGLKTASVATGEWASAAGRSIETATAKFNGVDFSVATTKAKAETLKLIQLQGQLDVARIAGDKKTSAALNEQIQLLTKVRALRAVGFTQQDATHAAGAQLAGLAAAERQRQHERELAEAAERRPNIGKAVTSTVDRARLGVIEEGSAKIPIFAGAIEALGPIGVAAAAGLFAVSEAAEQVRKAMEFAEDVEKTSHALGVATDTLQAFDYAAKSSGVGIDKGREALEGFNSVLGGYIAHVGDGKSAKFFTALGFTREDAKDVTDTGVALQDILEKLAKLPSQAERSRFADGLGISALLPVLGQGSAGVEEFVAKIHEAQGAGAIIDPVQIHRAAELNDKVEALDYLIGQHLKESFIALAPEIEAVTSFLEKCANAIAHIATAIPEVIRGLGDMGHSLSTTLNVANGALRIAQGDVVGGAGQIIGAARDQGRFAKLRDGVHDAFSGGRVDFSLEREEAERGKRGVQLGQDKERRGPRDRTDEIAKASDDAIEAAKKVTADAAKGEATAQLALTSNLAARAKAEEAAALAARDEANAAIDRRTRDAAADAKKITPAAAAEIARQGTLAKGENDRAAGLKVDKIQRDLPLAEDADYLRSQEEIAGRYRAIAQDALAMADTSAERRAIATKLLLDDQRDERLREQNEDATSLAADPSDANRSHVAARRQSLLDSQASARARNAQENLGPTGDYVKGLQDEVADGGQKLEVSGLQAFNENLLGVATHAKSAKEALHDMFTSILADLARLELTQNIELPIANALGLGTPGGGGGLGAFGAVGGLFGGLFGGGAAKAPSDFVSSFTQSQTGPLQNLADLIPGFAGGTDSAPGGLAVIGENGPELLNLPRGSAVYPNSTLQALAAVTPRVFSAGQSVIQGPQFTLHNPVVTQDLLDQMSSISRQHAAQATARAVSISSKAAPARQASYQALGT